MEEYPSMSDCLDQLRTGKARMAFASWTCATIRYWLSQLDFTGFWPVWSVAFSLVGSWISIVLMTTFLVQEFVWVSAVISVGSDEGSLVP